MFRDYGLKNTFFRNKTFLFFKIESWNFQHLFEKEFCETSQDFNSLSSFRQLLFPFFYPLFDWVEILWGLTKFCFKQMLKVSDFYLEKQKFYFLKKYLLGCWQYQNKKTLFTDSIFKDGFGLHVFLFSVPNAGLITNFGFFVILVAWFSLLFNFFQWGFFFGKLLSWNEEKL